MHGLSRGDTPVTIVNSSSSTGLFGSGVTEGDSSVMGPGLQGGSGSGSGIVAHAKGWGAASAGVGGYSGRGGAAAGYGSPTSIPESDSARHGGGSFFGGGEALLVCGRCSNMDPQQRDQVIICEECGKGFHTFCVGEKKIVLPPPPPPPGGSAASPRQSGTRGGRRSSRRTSLVGSAPSARQRPPRPPRPRPLSAR
ncbi:unnamed protein product [Discosporangium mesarthrocarpum]